MEFQLAKFLKAPSEEFAYHNGRVLRGLNFKFKGTSVLLVVKAEGRLDGKVVAFIESDSTIGCLSYLARTLYSNDAPLNYRPDRFG